MREGPAAAISYGSRVDIDGKIRSSSTPGRILQIVILGVFVLIGVLLEIRTDRHRSKLVTESSKLERSNADTPKAASAQAAFAPNIYFAEGIANCQSNNVVRPYSISNYTFNTINNRTCTTLDETLSAIKSGTRRWINHTINAEDSQVAERYPSYFVPKGCDIPLLSPNELCAILNRYSQILVVGDSLSRHMMQGLMMLLKGDLVSGAIGSSSVHHSSAGTCDSQFSEPNIASHLYGFTPKDLGLCPDLSESNGVEIIANGSIEEVVNRLDCTATDYKGANIVIQGGAHFDMDNVWTLGDLFGRIINHIMFKACYRSKKVRVIWIAFGAQSRKNDAKYPKQSRENALVFNAKMEIGVRERFPDVVIIDWWRLSKDSQTSDGYYYLSDVNAVKANHLANIIGTLEVPAKKQAPVTISTDSSTLTSSKGVSAQAPFAPNDYFQEGITRCQSNNFVRNRMDGIHGQAVVEKRLYSISNHTFNTINNRTCTTLDETLSAIKNGTRRWINHTINAEISLVAEKYPSYYVPKGCDIPLLSPNELCAILNRYSQILVVGDSLSRHMMQGLMMLLKGDLVSGAIESPIHSGDGSLYQCTCDGQYSEHEVCRENQTDHFDGFTPEDLGLCSDLPESDTVHIVAYGSSVRVSSILDCTAADYKGGIVVIQGGPHFHTDAGRTLRDWVDPIVDNLMFKACLRSKKVRVIWIAFGAQSRKLDGKYRHQSRENALVFNVNMEIGIKERLPDVAIIDWWRLTKDSQTSDGFHYLSDINVVKANHLAYIINYLA